MMQRVALNMLARAASVQFRNTLRVRFQSCQRPDIAVAFPINRRNFVTTPTSNDKVKVTFVSADDERIECMGHIGDTLLDVAIDNNIDLEGACGGTLACSTCHLYIDEASFEKLDAPEEEEEDMLDLAFDLRDTSRLGCQIRLSKALDGIECGVPNETADAR
eukprot:m.176071 g.176071  ORF g.176071 m.176071 type:complete len:162 (-) comp31841_c3_seq1:245-730(-)